MAKWFLGTLLLGLVFCMGCGGPGGKPGGADDPATTTDPIQNQEPDPNLRKTK